MEGILYVSLIEISSVVIETQGTENGDLVALVNNTLCATRLSWPLTHDHVS